jgi:hypothetical protein
MKSILNYIWTMLVAFGEARYAASLARQGRVAEAKAVYGS